MIKKDNIFSPCIEKCTLDETELYCTKCFRTINEIKYWSRYSDDIKSDVLKNCEVRKTKDTTWIPKGVYCYTPIKFNSDDGSLDIDICPFWGRHPDKHHQENGFCVLTGDCDWGEHWGLLWDQCKSCGINDFSDEDFK